MCIITVKPIGLLMPDNHTLNTCWQGNSDGAGLAYWRPGMNTVIIDKGFMKLKALKIKLAELQLGKNDMVILHFRWATHGLQDAGNCHPFPLSNKMEALRAVNGQFDTVIAHNGVFGNMACHETLSDTQKFISKIMCNPAVIGNLDNPAIVELIGGYCGTSSKLAILRPGKLLLIGGFEKDVVSGLLYSNNGYKPFSSGFTNWRDFPNDDTPIPASVGIPKCCELCQATKDIEYVEDWQIFLCDKCFETNINWNNEDSDSDDEPIEKEWEGHLN